ncbi:hypothetical protein FIU94_08075 [Sulfitobacter sp. THAF37]|uniref:antifreeze protein n=1 Tax=Sulfitobacter sp. THAF37 TaxID=2587855 RepID=UPI0012690C94|nr:antifreeze protein [Sulfitobacter sp. THAF37]QFT58780.1 hypothetical protein FIU94_08075 [Sulfitobacter sp. THAF37]
MYPLHWLTLSTNTVLLALEAQTVMTLRLMAIGGLIPQKSGENDRMVAEKLPALTKSGIAAGKAMMKGQRPDQVMSAALTPLRRRVRANRKRLMK